MVLAIKIAHLGDIVTIDSDIHQYDSAGYNGGLFQAGLAIDM